MSTEQLIYIPDLWGIDKHFYAPIVSWDVDGDKSPKTVKTPGGSLNVIRLMDESSSAMSQVFVARASKLPRVSIIINVRSGSTLESRAIFYFYRALPVGYWPKTSISGDRVEALRFEYDSLSEVVDSGGALHFYG